MTTAHRPTIVPAKGHEEQGGMRIFAPSRMQSAKDMAAHTKLKFRQEGQNTTAEQARKDLREELFAKERKHFAKKGSEQFEEERQEDLKLLEGVASGEDGKPAKMLVPKAIDADDADSGSEDDSDDDDDESDDEAQLLAELARIKQERAEEAAKAAAEAAKKAEDDVRAEVLRGNPLVQAAGAQDQELNFGVKRRWDDDVVFKNQDRGAPKKQLRFINDTIRSDFHRRFMDRYIK